MTEIVNTIIFPIVRTDRILTALRTLRACTPANYKTIVIDQSKPDEGWAFTREVWEEADLIIKPHLNYGFAQAANMGLRIAPTRYVTVCNDDVEFIPGHDWWQGILDTFARFPRAAAVNPQTPKCPGWGWAEPGYRYQVPEHWFDSDLRALGDRSRDLQREFREVRLAAHDAEQRGEPDEALESRLRSLRREMIAHRARMAPLVYEATMADPAYVTMLAEDMNWAVIDGFPCWLTIFKRELLDEIGLFDERFFPGGGEDYDMLHRIYRADCRGLATSRSWAWHWWGQSKDEADGLQTALPAARPHWNKLSTQGFAEEGLYDPDCDVWANWGHRTDEIVYQAML